jgi:hypothetical protein
MILVKKFLKSLTLILMNDIGKEIFKITCKSCKNNENKF